MFMHVWHWFVMNFVSFLPRLKFLLLFRIFFHFRNAKESGFVHVAVIDMTEHAHEHTEGCIYLYLFGI